MSAPLIDGGPAFPGANPAYDNMWDKRVTVGGMTMRQWYKGKALPCVFNIATEACRAGGVPMGKEEIANRCGLIADAMLAEDEEHAKR